MSKTRKEHIQDFKIISKGSATNTEISIGGQKIGYVQKVTFTIDVKDLMPKVILEVYCPDLKINVTEADCTVIEKSAEELQ